ncbi:hypothetical protein [Allorhizocola rhizosphaerae]|uniref:hypothetical protein n=1 Tax=Allorhizocola rhizosphaerae TaxID=1872709 RepID=UPI000E3DED30|nr:hypothetical protein [Allorhizocola rhizosphaerae]
MEQYSRRDNLGQYRAQQAFHEVMTQAVEAVGLRRGDWTTQQAGDGELGILPPDASEPTVVAELVPALDRLLRQYNRGLLPEAKVRLRVAIHQGLVHLGGANGFPGDAVNEVCRLRDADVLRHALKTFGNASVALIVSESIFRDVVRHGYRGLRPERFAPVRVKVKDFNAPAWIYVPDENASTLTMAEGADNPSMAESATADAIAPVPATQRAQVSDAPTYQFNGVTTHGPAVFGPDGTAIGTVNLGGTDGAQA